MSTYQFDNQVQSSDDGTGLAILGCFFLEGIARLSGSKALNGLSRIAIKEAIKERPTMQGGTFNIISINHPRRATSHIRGTSRKGSRRRPSFKIRTDQPKPMTVEDHIRAAEKLRSDATKKEFLKEVEKYLTLPDKLLRNPKQRGVRGEYKFEREWIKEIRRQYDLECTKLREVEAARLQIKDGDKADD